MTYQNFCSLGFQRRHYTLGSAILLFLLLIGYSGQAQVAANFAPNSINPSPGATSLAQFAAMPVDLQHGRVNVQIPLCQLDQMQVSLAYHTGGIKVKDIASHVGLGWSLNAGGMITRVVRDKPDDLQYGYAGGGAPDNGGVEVEAFVNSPDEAKAKEKFLGISGDIIYDQEPDIFYFNLMGYTGRFILDKDRNVVMTPYQNIRIQYYVSNGPNFNRSWWLVTLPDGTTFVVGDGNEYAYKERTNYNTTFTPLCTSSGPATVEEFVSTWYLKEVMYPNGETLHFEYSQGGNITYTDIIQNQYDIIRVITDRASGKKPDCGPAVGIPDSYDITQTTTTKYAKYISRIYSDRGEIRFTYNGANDASREDLTGGKYLKQVALYNKKNQKIQQFDLRYYYSGGLNAERMLLEEVKQEGFQPYKFYYHGITLPNRNSFATDHWGYYTNPGNNPVTHGIPATQYTDNSNVGSVSVLFYEGISKDADFSGTQAQSLHKIQFPSGAATEYIYELNTYKDPISNTTKAGAGLRIKEIITSTARWQGEVISHKRYTYEEETTAAQFIPQYAKRIIIETAPRTLVRRKEAWYLHRSSQPLNIAGLTSDNAVVYRKVREFNEGEGNNGQTIYEFTGFEERPDVITPKHFLSGTTLYPRDADIAPYLPDATRSWERGLLKNISVYDRDGHLRSETRYTYDFDRTKNKKVPGIGFYYDRVVTDASGGSSKVTILSILYYGKYEEASRWVALTQTLERTYDLEGTNYVETITDYAYKDNTEVRSVTNTDGKGNTYETTYRYADDFTANADGDAMSRSLDLMRKRFMVGIPIEKRTTIQKGNAAPARLLESTLHLYQLNTGSLFKDYIQYPYGNRPETENTPVLKEVLHFKAKKPIANVPLASISGNNFTYDDRYESEATLVKYDEKDRPLEIKEQDGLSAAKIYDTQGRLVAEVLNATYDQVAFENFETDLLEGWTQGSVDLGDFASSNRLAEPMRFTGEAAFSNGTLSHSFPALPNGKQYVVSLWATNAPGAPKGELVVEGTTYPVDGFGWQYFEWKLPAGSPLTFDITVKYAWIDDLRVYPEGARMKTYTYQDLIGLDSETDANHNTIHYEYDDLNRIKNIRDEEGNILRNYQYYNRN